jgi:methyl-accepting chemotaxis protein
MKWFYNLSTKSKLIGGFGIIIFMIIIMVFNTQSQIRTLYGNQRLQDEKNFHETIGILRINININGIRSTVRDMIIGNSSLSIDTLKKDVDQRMDTISNYLSQVHQINLKWSNTVKDGKIDELSNILNEFVTAVKQDIIPKVIKGQNKEAEKIVYGVQVQRYKKIRMLIQELQNEANYNSEELIRQSAETYKNTLTVSIIIGLIVIGISVLIVFVFIKTISNPLKKMSSLTAKIEKGELNVFIEKNENKDEIGNLITGFNSMISSIRNMIQDVAETIDVLSSASVQISSSSSQLATSSNETATSVTETTATVEEVRQTTNVSNVKAKQVAESSHRATQVSAAGKKYTDETIDGINKVGSQMESIADSIIKLSEQSRAISEIISSVNDLAEQTNLLAVNASIEAARAGEQGKGFAVVAQEIKSLADQSKQATTQVRTILNEIQNAIAAAVMATEQGSKMVDAGIKQSTQTGSAIQSIAESINEAAQLAVQISASSQEQSVGMDQVALAMENIKYASLQNAQTTKQLESSAKNLKDMGNKLKDLIQNYKV